MALEWSVTMGPEEEPVSLDEVKTHLRFTGTAEDDLIAGLITAAREQCELVARRALVAQTIALRLPAWPPIGVLRLPQPPLIEVLSVEYIDAAGEAQTMPADDYYVYLADPGMIVLRPTGSWPTAELMPGTPVTVTFRAGYGAPGAVPRRYRQAILLLVGTWFATREHVVMGTVAREMPDSVRALLLTDRG
jgi:uncharacterized phiE125 gp8 family phage protein